MDEKKKGWDWNKGCVGVHHDDVRCALDDPEICERCKENYEAVQHGA